MNQIPPVLLPAPLRDRLFAAEWGARLRSQLPSAIDEPWRCIPWKLSLLEARRVAAREKKPLVMLVRSGHPLGCT